MVPSLDRIIRKLSKKWRRMREKSARYKDTKAILDELELFFPEDLVAAVDETLDALDKGLEEDDPYAKARFEVFFATLAELLRAHARNNNPGDLAELDRVLQMTKRWRKEGMKTKSAVSIRDEDEKKGKK